MLLHKVISILMIIFDVWPGIYLTHSPESVGGSLPIVILVISRLHCKSLHEKLDLHPIYPEQIWYQKFQTRGVLNTVFVLEFTTPQGTYHLCPWSLLCSIGTFYIFASYLLRAHQFDVNRPFHGFFNFWHGQFRENPSTLLERAPLN